MAEDLFGKRTGTGGRRESFEIVTHARTRFEVDGSEPAMRGAAVDNTPAAPTQVGSGTFFFRNDGAGKAQLCVRFPSGAVQILATEP
jgi:hypothetical protein